MSSKVFKRLCGFTECLGIHCLHDTVNILKFPTRLFRNFLPKFCFYAFALQKYLNTVDLDQTAPSGAVWSVSVLFTDIILSGKLVYKI